MRRRGVALIAGGCVLFVVLAFMGLLLVPLLSGDIGFYERTRLGRWFLTAGLHMQLPDFGAPIAPIVVRDRVGQPARLPTRGRAMVINYWASWCGPCRREMPLLNAFAARNATNGPEVVGIALDDPIAVENYLADSPVPFRVLIETPSDADSSVRLGNDWGLLPYSVLVGADGRLLARKIGPFKDAAELEDWASPAR